MTVTETYNELVETIREIEALAVKFLKANRKPVSDEMMASMTLKKAESIQKARQLSKQMTTLIAQGNWPDMPEWPAEEKGGKFQKDLLMRLVVQTYLY